MLSLYLIDYSRRYTRETYLANKRTMKGELFIFKLIFRSVKYYIEALNRTKN